MSGTVRSVCNYEEDTVSNDDENDGFRRAHGEPEGLFSPAGPRVTAYSIETVTRVTSRDIMCTVTVTI